MLLDVFIQRLDGLRGHGLQASVNLDQDDLVLAEQTRLDRRDLPEVPPPRFPG